MKVEVYQTIDGEYYLHSEDTMCDTDNMNYDDMYFFAYHLICLGVRVEDCTTKQLFRRR